MELEPKKMNLPGSPMTGASFTVGRVTPGATIHIVEGIATAWACQKATWATAVVCFGWGNVAKVATALRQRDLNARLVICPDVGKESAAELIARELNCAIAYMPRPAP